MLMGLLIVLGLAFVLIKYVLPKTQMGRRSRAKWLTILDRVPLESRKSVYLLKIGSRYFAVGMAEQSVNVIAELPSAEGEKIENE